MKTEYFNDFKITKQFEGLEFFSKFIHSVCEKLIEQERRFNYAEAKIEIETDAVVEGHVAYFSFERPYDHHKVKKYNPKVPFYSLRYSTEDNELSLITDLDDGSYYTEASEVFHRLVRIIEDGLDVINQPFSLHKRLLTQKLAYQKLGFAGPAIEVLDAMTGSKHKFTPNGVREDSTLSTARKRKRPRSSGRQ